MARCRRTWTGSGNTRNRGRLDPTMPQRTPAQIMDMCASCHARRADLTGDFKPGDAFFDHYDLTIVDHSDLFYPGRPDSR